MEIAAQQAFEQAKYERTLRNQIDLAKAKYLSLSTFGYNGGMFIANTELVQFAKLMIDENKIKHPILDKNNNPIMIEDFHDFYAILLGRYTEILNEYYVEYEKLKNARTTEAVINV